MTLLQKHYGYFQLMALGDLGLHTGPAQRLVIQALGRDCERVTAPLPFTAAQLAAEQTDKASRVTRRSLVQVIKLERKTTLDGF